MARGALPAPSHQFQGSKYTGAGMKKDFPFVSRTQANDSKKLILRNSSGKDTGFYLMVASIHSDTAKIQKSRVQREIAESVVNNKHSDAEQIRLISKLVASTITGWKLPEEFGEYSKENAEKFLHEYPEICDAVDVFSTRDANYLEKKYNA